MVFGFFLFFLILFCLFRLYVFVRSEGGVGFCVCLGIWLFIRWVWRWRFFVGWDVMLLYIVWIYCIFSTLPLDVENAVIHTMDLRGGGYCCMRCSALVNVWMYCIFSTLPLDVENAVIHTMNSEGDFLVLPCLCFYGRMFEDFTDSIESVDSFFPTF